MSNNNTTVRVKILDKEYQVSCPPEEESDLRQSADMLDNKMRAIRKNSNVIGVERIAVMAALNIANDLLSQKDCAEKEQGTKLQGLCDKIDQVLVKHSQIEL